MGNRSLCRRKVAAIGASGLMMATALVLAGPQVARANVPEVHQVIVKVSTQPEGQRVFGKWVGREAICTSGENFAGTATTSTRFSIRDSLGCRISPLVVAAYSVEIAHWPYDVVLRAHQVGPGFVTSCTDRQTVKTTCKYSFGHGVGTISLTLKTNFR